MIYAHLDQENESKAFDEMLNRDVISWNIIFGGYVVVGEINTTFELFEKMTNKNVVSWSLMVLGYSKARDMTMERMLFEKLYMFRNPTKMKV